MKKIYALSIISFIFFNTANIAFADFGSYDLYGGDYRSYALGQTIQNQKRRAAIARQRYNYYSNPLRRIKYPSANNPYPNIQQSGNYGNISARQRYSPRYYESVYGY